MYPEIFRIGNFVVSSFGLMMVVAFIAGYFQLLWGFRRLGIGGEEDASAVVFAAGVGGIVGAKVYYALLYGDWRLLLDRSGLVWYGGFLLATVLVLWVGHRRRLSPWRLIDALCPGLALGYGIGRVGCFLVGDDYGLPTNLPWGVEFPHGLPETTAGVMRQLGVEVPPEIPDAQLLAVHPTQLYETALALGIWWLGRRLLLRSTRPGTVGLVMLSLMVVERFAIEFLRAKDDRFLDGFTVAQLISVLVLAALAVLWTRRPRQDRDMQAAEELPGRA